MPRYLASALHAVAVRCARAIRRLPCALLLAALLSPLPAATADAPQDAAPRSVLLVASSRLKDSSFSRSVVLVTQHGGRGPIGVILNRPSEHALGEVFEDEPALRGVTEPLYFGGPVAPQTLVFVLRADEPPGSAVELLPGLFMSLDAGASLRRLRERGATGDVRVFAGYAGWAPGQLEKEIAHGQWHLLPADAQTVLSPEPQALWEQLLRRATLKSVRGQRRNGPQDVTRMARKSFTLVSVGPLTRESPSAKKNP